MTAFAIVALSACSPREGSFTAKWSGTINDAAVSGSKTLPLKDGSQWLIQETDNTDSNLPTWHTSTMVVPTGEEKAGTDWPPFTLTVKGASPCPPSPLLSVKGMFTVPLVGKGMTRAVLTRGEPAETVVDITGVKLTGEARTPIEVQGAYSGRIQNNVQFTGKSDLSVEGTFTVFPSCEGNAPTHTQFMCDAFYPDTHVGDRNIESTDYLGDSNVNVPWYPAGLGEPPAACPDGIFSKFVQRASAHYETGALDIGGQKLSCTGHFCTGEAKGVDAGGCKWDVTAIAQVGANRVTNPGSIGAPVATNVWVSAVAQSGCGQEMKFCQAR